MAALLLFKNFLAAARKANLSRFGIVSSSQDTSWIDNAPTAPLTELTVAYSATPAFDVSLAQVLTITLTGNVTSSSLNYGGSSTIPDGSQVWLRIVQDSTGGRTFALPANVITDQNFAVDTGASRAQVLPLQYSQSLLSWIFFSEPFSIKTA